MNGVLTYGGYSCLPEHAVRESFILSTAQAAYERYPGDMMELGEIIMLYVSGRYGFDEAIAALNEDLEDTNEATAAYEARDDDD